jgi:hypothetical protein
MDMRKRLILLAFLTAIYLPSYARVDSGKVVYVGGTVADLKQEAEGTFSTADAKELVFQYHEYEIVHHQSADLLHRLEHDRRETKEGKFTIPYDRIDSLEYGQKAGRRLGLAIVATPAALLSKKRRHYLTVNYKDADDRQQAAVFELGKHIVRVTLSSLEARTGRRIEYQDDEARNSSKGD